VSRFGDLALDLAAKLIIGNLTVRWTLKDDKPALLREGVEMELPRLDSNRDVSGWKIPAQLLSEQTGEIELAQPL